MPMQPERAANPPAHQIVYERIRAMVLYGDLAPGQPVTIQGLAQTVDSGMTPVREAIRRLTAEGALVMAGNRRVLVPELDAATLEELSFLRLTVEPRLAALATPRISEAEIDRLEAIDTDLDRAIAEGDVGAYLRLNHAFHRLLYAHSGTRLLRDTAEALSLRAGPSLRVVCGRYGTLNLPDMHEEAVAALRARDPEATARAIHEDIEQGHGQIARALSSGVDSPGFDHILPPNPNR